MEEKIFREYSQNNSLAMSCAYFNKNIDWHKFSLQPRHKKKCSSPLIIETNGWFNPNWLPFESEK